MRLETDPAWQALGALVGERLGLEYPPPRLAELRRGCEHAAAALGVEADARWLQRLCTQPWPPALQDALARHLTIGETYFFRDPASFATLAECVLPELLQLRRSERRLRLWSAGCCTGEEAYSLAIVLRQHVPDFTHWQIRILATDIRSDFLRRAEAGVFGEWSFRGCSAAFRQRYFERAADGRYRIDPELRALIEFAPLNLAEPVYPTLGSGTTGMDLILCRNVLMYFSAAQAQRVGERLSRALRPGGWLALAPGELAPGQLPLLETVSASGNLFFRKSGVGAAVPTAPQGENDAIAIVPAPGLMLLPPLSRTTPGSTTAPALAAVATAPAVNPRTLALVVHAFADGGRLDDALRCCERWIGMARLDAEAHYLRAVLLHELGELDAAYEALQRVLYLQPASVMAHFALGNIERARGRANAAQQQFELALELLAPLPPAHPVPLAEGLRVAELREALRSALALQADWEHAA